MGEALTVGEGPQRARDRELVSRPAGRHNAVIMKSERDKMLAGELYDPMDPLLREQRRRARLLQEAFNRTSVDEPEERLRLLGELIPASGSGLEIEPPFFCDYGHNITLGDRVFINYNCVILDVAPVRIGSRVLLGPAVQIYAATHPAPAEQRRTGLELGFPIEIGDDVWIGGGSIICPGVRVGEGAVIGAGSVVRRNVPRHAVVAGNPCRMLRRLAKPVSGSPFG